MKIKENCLLDTSALLAYTDNEPGSEIVGTVLEDAKSKKLTVSISSMTIMELFYIAFQELGKDAAKQIVVLARSLPIEELPLSEDLVLSAGDFKARYRVSVADAWIAATAKQHGLLLVHKDPEFEPLKEEIALAELPYKGSRSM